MLEQPSTVTRNLASCFFHCVRVYCGHLWCSVHRCVRIFCPTHKVSLPSMNPIQELRGHRSNRVGREVKERAVCMELAWYPVSPWLDALTRGEMHQIGFCCQKIILLITSGTTVLAPFVSRFFAFLVRISTVIRPYIYCNTVSRYILNQRPLFWSCPKHNRPNFVSCLTLSRGLR